MSKIGPSRDAGAKGFRWYHLYFVLAGFDALVILAGLWLHHRTARGFRDLLVQTAMLDARQRELTALGQAVLQMWHCRLDSVITDPMPTLPRQERLHALALHIGEMKARTSLRGERFEEVWEDIRRLLAAQQALADETVRGPPAEANGGPAATSLGDIEEQQFAALRRIAAHQESLLSQAAELHADHARVLERQEAIERLLAAALILALGAMIAFTRRLQRADDELRAQRQRAEDERRDRLAVIGEVCTGVAHGIQNPLAAIQSSAELLLDLGRMDDDARRRAADVLAESCRLSHRVRRLLTFARTPATPRGVLDAADVAESVARELAPRLKVQNQHIEVNVPHLPVRAEPEELGSVLLELLGNAIDHTPPGGRIELIGHRRDGRAELEIHDSGPGIPPGTSEHVFDLFFTTQAQGTGVGLAWARRIAESLGGTLALIAGPSKGAVFRLSLPLDHIDSLEERRAAPAAEVPAAVTAEVA